MSGRQERFRRDCDQVLSKRMVQSVKPGATLVFEDLTDIRTRVKLRQRERRRLHSWSFARLLALLSYQAALTGVSVVMADPRCTSHSAAGAATASRRTVLGATFAASSVVFRSTRI